MHMAELQKVLDELNKVKSVTVQKVMPLLPAERDNTGISKQFIETREVVVR